MPRVSATRRAATARLSTPGVAAAAAAAHEVWDIPALDHAAGAERARQRHNKAARQARREAKLQKRKEVAAYTHAAGKRAALRGGRHPFATLEEWAAKRKVRVDAHLARGWVAGWREGAAELATVEASSPRSTQSWGSTVSSVASHVGGAVARAGRAVSSAAGRLYEAIPTGVKVAAGVAASVAVANKLFPHNKVLRALASLPRELAPGKKRWNEAWEARYAEYDDRVAHKRAQDATTHRAPKWEEPSIPQARDAPARSSKPRTWEDAVASRRRALMDAARTSAGTYPSSTSAARAPRSARARPVPADALTAIELRTRAARARARDAIIE